MALEAQERNRIDEIVKEVVFDTPRGSIKGKLDDPRYYALCKYFHVKFNQGGSVADIHAQDVMEILDMMNGKPGTV